MDAIEIIKTTHSLMAAGQYALFVPGFCEDTCLGIVCTVIARYPELTS